ncbi:MAG: hypothetical protein IT450_10835 [Phycisphaerales bacterium]|nr:hypothetical protein [Phycisphaerales bacterium]
MMHEICTAIASETAILDALLPHYDLQTVEREFEWASTMAQGYDDPAEVRWESVFDKPARFPIVTNHRCISNSLQFYITMVAHGNHRNPALGPRGTPTSDRMVAHGNHRNPALVSLFAAALMREYTPGRHDVDPQWLAVFFTQAQTLGAPVVLAATQFVAWHFLATRSSAQEDSTSTLAVAIGLGYLTSRLARHFRDASSNPKYLGCFDPKTEFPVWRAAIDDVLTFGNGVDESLWYAREALHIPNDEKRR